MKKIITSFLLMISFGLITSEAQVQPPTVRINRDRASTVQRLPEEIRAIAEQVQLPRADDENRLKALGIQIPSSSFTLSPENMRVPGKGSIDFVNPILVLMTGSPNNTYMLSPVAFLPPGVITNGGRVGLRIKNNTRGSRYLVDVKTTSNAQILVNGSQGVQVNSNGHAYFTLTATGYGDLNVNVSGSSSVLGKFVFFGFEISKLN